MPSCLNAGLSTFQRSTGGSLFTRETFEELADGGIGDEGIDPFNGMRTSRMTMIGSRFRVEDPKLSSIFGTQYSCCIKDSRHSPLLSRTWVDSTPLAGVNAP